MRESMAAERSGPPRLDAPLRGRDGMRIGFGLRAAPALKMDDVLAAHAPSSNRRALQWP
jgi:hypothetical protein